MPQSALQMRLRVHPLKCSQEAPQALRATFSAGCTESADPVGPPTVLAHSLRSCPMQKRCYDSCVSSQKATHLAGEVTARVAGPRSCKWRNLHGRDPPQSTREARRKPSTTQHEGADADFSPRACPCRTFSKASGL